MEETKDADPTPATDNTLVFEDPEEFENFDLVDSEDVELPEDSFDESAAKFDDEDTGEHC